MAWLCGGTSTSGGSSSSISYGCSTAIPAAASLLLQDEEEGAWAWQQIQSWIAYLLFSPCPQHTLVALFNSAFLLSQFSSPARLLLTLRRRRRHQLVLTPPPPASTNGSVSASTQESGGGFTFFFLFFSILTCFAAAALAFISLALTFALAWQLLHLPSAVAMTISMSIFIREAIFSAVESSAWIASFVLLLRERPRKRRAMPLRVWWFASFLLAVLQLLTSLSRLSSQVEEEEGGVVLGLLDRYYSWVKFPLSLFLAWAAIDGRTGGGTLRFWTRGQQRPPLTSTKAWDEVSEPLMQKMFEEKEEGYPVEGMAAASVFSKATFSWLNPVLTAGRKRSLAVRDVPDLTPRDRAHNMYRLLQSKWPPLSNNTDQRHPLRAALLRCFWPHLLLTASLQFTRTLVIYAGPLLITSFTSYAASDDRSTAVFRGYVLVLLLVAAKTLELFCYHHYNFQCYRLGNNVRTAVITLLYRKSLRLSSAARRSHGVGQITNYMVVDAQLLSDSCLQLHMCWSLPLQVIIALVLVYRVVGVSAVAGTATMVGITYITFSISQRQKMFYGLVMKARDGRMKSIAEVLAYMKVIKLQAWEETFQAKVESSRRQEFSYLTKLVNFTVFSMFMLWNTLPIVSTLTYVIAVLTNAGLTTAEVFTAAAVFKIVQEPIRSLPPAAVNITQLFVCLERLDAYMTSPELGEGEEAVMRSELVEERTVVIENGRFAWSELEEPTLQDINLCVRQGSLVTIVGMVGSGKSSLLAAVLGEMVKLSGTVRVCGRVAYVAQTPWIQNASIKENILFGSDWDAERYKEVVRACALEPDFAALDFGDETEIGEKGINLSGGQKQRIQLARAMYQRCDVYLLDDIFSAVDAHTGSHVFKECVLGLLKQKTILLVTHQVEFLTGADLVVVMKEGRIGQSGAYHEILSVGTDFAALVAAHNRSLATVVNHDREAIRTDRNIIGNQSNDKKTSASDPSIDMHMAAAEEEEQQLPSKTIISHNPIATSSSESLEPLPPAAAATLTDSFSFESPRAPAAVAATATPPAAASKLIQDEQRETGRVNWVMYWLYFTKVYGWMMVAALLLDQCVWQASLLASDYWLANEVPQDASQEQSMNKQRFIIVYVALNVTAMVGVLVRVMLVAKLGLETAQVFFHDMLRSIFRAPMSFFDTTPSGRILSRFTADQSNVDFGLHATIGGCISNYFSALGVLIVLCISAWPILLLIVPLAWLYYLCQNFYLSSSREMTRLESITKAPLIYHFSETVAGVETIRCFRKQEAFIQENEARVDTNMKMDFHNLTAKEWLGLRLEAIGTAILCTTAFFFVVLPKTLINTETVALALSYALSLNSSLYTTVWLTCTIENNMVSVERIRQFSTIPEEALRHIPDRQPSADWPTKGQIVLDRLKLRYRPSTPLVLKGVSLAVEGGEKVGVVGRTGSGKSSLVLALLRLVEACGGKIWIDGIDISSMGLLDLRRRLGVIPQEPVLFEGTIRANLDPAGQFSDDEIWQTLEKCQLAHVIKEKPEKLEVSVSEYGSNWSVGQRQLLCFGRALLRRSKVLFLDEATASVDTRTDLVIQRIIGEEFRQSTVVSIAHRIPSVMDFHRVLVMDAGRVKEFDRPSKLLSHKESLFASLVREYSARAAR